MKRTQYAMGIAILFTVAMTTTGCKSTPPSAQPADAASAAAVGVIELKGNVLVPSVTAQRIYYIRADQLGRYEQAEVLTSSYFNDSRVYMLNPAPGRYVIVGFYELARNDRSQVHRYGFFKLDDIKKTEFSIEAGKLNFIGKINLQGYGPQVRTADKYQNFFAEKIAPGVVKYWEAGAGKTAFELLLKTNQVSHLAQVGAVARDEATTQSIKQEVAADWAGTAWSGYLN